MSNDRFVRQSGWVSQNDIKANSPVCVIGLGAIGRQLVVQLCAMGVTDFLLFDHDIVDDTNRTTQGYRKIDVGKPKITVMSEYLALEDAISLDPRPAAWAPGFALGPCVFCCVDSISMRSTIWKQVQEEVSTGKVKFWCDGRMNGMSLKILSAWDALSFAHYGTTIFDQTEAQSGSCTQRSTIWTASLAVSRMIQQYVMFLRGMSTDGIDLEENIATREITDMYSFSGATPGPATEETDALLVS